MQRIYTRMIWHRGKGWKLTVFLNLKRRQDAGVSGNGDLGQDRAVRISVKRMNANFFCQSTLVLNLLLQHTSLTECALFKTESGYVKYVIDFLEFLPSPRTFTRVRVEIGNRTVRFGPYIRVLYSGI
jgi:hypothetical protein